MMMTPNQALPPVFRTHAVLRLFDILGGGNGDTLRIVGGAVRDFLWGRPIADIDFATRWHPDAVVAALQNADIKTLLYGYDHGTVTALIDGHHFEITTLRCDVETDGRHARVIYTDDWAIDAQRRDFTINALSMDATGHIYDYAGGLDDIKTRRVRFIGDAATRIAEDVLRVLRFFRFHAGYGAGDMDTASLQACLNAAGQLPSLSADRVRHEILKLLLAPRAIDVLPVLRERDILRPWLGVVSSSLSDFELLCQHEQQHECRDTLRRLACLVMENKNECDVAHLLNFSRQDSKRFKTMLSPVCDAITEPLLLRAMYVHGRQAVIDDVLLRHGHALHVLPFVTNTAIPVFPLTGDDLMRQGMKQSAALGAQLRHIEQWWVDHDFIPTRAECLARID